MKKIQIAVLILVGVVFIIGLVYFIVGSLKPKFAGAYIETSPSSSVWLNGKEVGKTPYRDTVKPGETVIKLIPDSFGTPLAPYDTKINFVVGVETVVRYDFGDTEDSSAGDIISFEKNPNGDTSLIAVSDPDSTQIVIDGRERAFTPHKTSSIAPGEHQLNFSAQGYTDRLVKVKIYEGYKLTAIVKLSKASNVQRKEEPSATPVPDTRDQVEILSTPTGYLRVRSEASSLGDEVGKVNPGERYPLVEIDTKTGWYKIEYEQGKTGWISSQYAKKIVSGTENSASASATLTPTKSLTPSTVVRFSPTPASL